MDSWEWEGCVTLRVQLMGICFECSQPLSGIRCKIPIKFFIFILIFAKLNVSLLFFFNLSVSEPFDICFWVEVDDNTLAVDIW